MTTKRIFSTALITTALALSVGFASLAQASVTAETSSKTAFDHKAGRFVTRAQTVATEAGHSCVPFTWAPKDTSVYRLRVCDLPVANIAQVDADSPLEAFSHGPLPQQKHYLRHL